MVIEPGTAAFLQWLISQGVGVAVAALVIWIVGRKIDQQNALIQQLLVRLQELADAIHNHVVA